jgi:hypothetical protein
VADWKEAYGCDSGPGAGEAAGPPPAKLVAFALAVLAALAAAYVLLIRASRSERLFYHDGTFSLSAFFLKTLACSGRCLCW